MLQQGQVTVRSGNWVLRFYEYDQGKRTRQTRILASYADYPLKPTETEKARELFKDKIAKYLAPVNVDSNSPASSPRLIDFIEYNYFPRLDWRLSVPPDNERHIEQTTISGYRDIFNVHVKEHPIAKQMPSRITPKNCQQFLENINQQLHHRTHMRIRAFLSGVLNWAVAEGRIQFNPMLATKAGGRKSNDLSKLNLNPTDRMRREKIALSNEHAYTLDEVAEMLEKLPDPARIVCAVAAFTGLSRSALMGLQWADYDGEKIIIRRKIVEGVQGAPKTTERRKPVNVIPLPQKMLAKHKKDFPPMQGDWIFRGERLGRPLNLDNISRRDIPSYINGAWFGWHAFRRGLGTRLQEAGVDTKIIQQILRHANVSTTQAFYIKPDDKQAKKAMHKLEKLARTLGIKV